MGAERGDLRYNLAVLIRASSRDEARGKGFRLIHRAYPAAAGYRSHNVFVSGSDKVVEVDSPLHLIVE